MMCKECNGSPYLRVIHGVIELGELGIELWKADSPEQILEGPSRLSSAMRTFGMGYMTSGSDVVVLISLHGSSAPSGLQVRLQELGWASQGSWWKRVAWGKYPFLESELQLTVTALRGTVVAATIVRHKTTLCVCARTMTSIATWGLASLASNRCLRCFPRQRVDVREQPAVQEMRFSFTPDQ